MAWQQTPYAFGYVAVAVSMCLIAALAYRSREEPGGKPLVALALLTAFWGATSAGMMVRTNEGGRFLFANLSYVAIATIPIALLFFAAEYTNRDVVLTRYGPLPLLAVPVITQIVAWTNQWHGLMWSTREFVITSGGIATIESVWGPWFWVHTVYSYVLTAVGTYLLLRMLIVSEDVYRWQAVTLLIGIFAPWVSNALYISGVVDVPVDPTPYAFSISALAFFFAISHHKLLDLVPTAREVARDEMMDNLAEGVFIVDDRGRIVDVNERGEQILDTPESELLGTELATVVPEFERVLDRDRGPDEESSDEVALRRNGTLRHYDVHVTELRRGGGLLAGQLVSIRDVTERRQREQRLDVLNRALRHDLRNEANVILGYAELGMKNNPDAEWVQEIQEHVSGMIDLSRKARQIEQAIGNGDVSPRPIDIVAVVEGAVEDVESERPDVDIDTDLPQTAHAQAIEFVGAAVTNALENAIEHNDNPDPLIDVSVAVEVADEGVLVEIADNGPGIHPDEQEVLLRGRETQLEHVSGLGLWIINWIVTESGGEVRFDENEPRGSVITIRLPEAEELPDEDAVGDPDADGTHDGDEQQAGGDGDDETERGTEHPAGPTSDTPGSLSSPLEGSDFGGSS